MSEKMYACLLRLFPSAFRRHYEEEALRLLRDRISEERGFFRRLRLNFDLIADIIGALPQAYRNSYAEVAPAASLIPDFDGVPSFRLLQKEPIRRVAIVTAGLLSLTAIATFPYVLDRSIRDFSAAQNGPMSPIESVIERLNQPISLGSADTVRSDAPKSALADLGRREVQPASTTNAVLSSGTSSATSATTQPVPSSEQNPTASDSHHGSSHAVAAPSSTPALERRPFAQSQPEPIQNVTQSANPSNMQDPIPAAAVAANLSGRWTVSLRAVDGDADFPRWFIFKEDSAKLTGTGGPHSTEQYPIIHGLVAGDSVKFELDHGRRRFLYDLKVENKELRGTLSIGSADEMRTTKVWLERAH